MLRNNKPPRGLGGLGSRDMSQGQEEYRLVRSSSRQIDLFILPMLVVPPRQIAGTVFTEQAIVSEMRDLVKRFDLEIAEKP